MFPVGSIQAEAERMMLLRPNVDYGSVGFRFMLAHGMMSFTLINYLHIFDDDRW